MRLLSLFSGIGAFEKALERLGVSFDLVNYCEIDKYASKAFSLIHNIPEERNLRDVKEVNTKSIADLDLITYGFPCQDISIAGLKKGFSDNGERTRSGLFFEALRIIEGTRPKIAIAENVKALVGKRFINEFNIVLGSLSRLGYNNYYSVLNAKDYGIPQNRERVFIVSIRQDIDKGFIFPSGYDLKLRLKDLLETDAILPIYHNIYGGFKETKPREFWDYSPTIRTAAGGGHIPSVKTDKTICLNSKGGRGGKEGLQPSIQDRVYSVEGIATACTTCYPTKILQGNEIRKLTPKECFRLMGFDDRDVDTLRENGISDTQLYKMAGNSIVVDVVYHIFEQLRSRYPDIFPRGQMSIEDLMREEG